MRAIFRGSLESPEVVSLLVYLATGFCILLAAFLAIVAFSVVVSLAIVSAVHLFSETLRPDHHEVEAEEEEASGTRRVLEALNRIIRERGRAAEEWGRRGAAVERLPPAERHGGLGGAAKECVICLEEFEAEDTCQVFPACRHVFHSDCIRHWLTANSTCPLCRTCILQQFDLQKSDF